MIAKAKADRSGVKCPLCRFVMQPAELTYVSVNSKKRKVGDDDIIVKVFDILLWL